MAWVFAVSFLGVWLGWFLRRRLIVDSQLVFPAGVATEETLRDIFAYGRETTRRVIALPGTLLHRIVARLDVCSFMRPSLRVQRAVAQEACHAVPAAGRRP